MLYQDSAQTKPLHATVQNGHHCYYRGSSHFSSSVVYISYDLFHSL